MTRTARFTLASAFALGVLALYSACSPNEVTEPRTSGPSLAATSNPTVTSTDPVGGKQGMTLDVQVIGSGFDNGSRADFLLNGQATTTVKTNSTRYVSSKQLVANITIATDALTDLYDVAVTTSRGRKGIGTELFTISTMTDLGTLGGATAWAQGINSAGAIVGSADNAAGYGRPYIWTQSAGMRDLGVLPGFSSGLARAINDSNVIAGCSGNCEPTVWTPTGGGGWIAQDLGGFGGTYADVTSINDSGVVVGMSSDAAGNSLAFRWTSATGLTRLPLPANGHSSQAFGINAGGVIVGQVILDPPIDKNVPSAWTSAGMVLLPLLPGGTSGRAYAINASGIITGTTSSATSGSNEVRWRPDPSHPGTWLAPEQGSATRGIAINDAGQIVGYASGSQPGSKTHPWLWQPDGSVQDLGALTKTGFAQPGGISSPATGQAQVVGVSNSRAVRWQLP
jgi:probable HAF family extracellular repeat protein